MSKSRDRISKCANDIITNVIQDDYIDAEKNTKVAAASNIASRISQECSKIRKQELSNKV